MMAHQTETRDNKHEAVQNATGTTMKIFPITTSKNRYQASPPAAIHDDFVVNNCLPFQLSYEAYEETICRKEDVGLKGFVAWLRSQCEKIQISYFTRQEKLKRRLVVVKSENKSLKSQMHFLRSAQATQEKQLQDKIVKLEEKLRCEKIDL